MSEHQNNVEHERIKQDLLDMQSLVRVISEVNGSLDLKQTLQASVEGIRQVVGGEFGGIILIRPNSTMELAYATALPADLFHLLASPAPLPEQPQLVQPPKTSTTILSLVGHHVSDALRQLGVGFIVMPLSVRGEAVGVLFVGAPEKKIINPPSVNLLMSIGEQVGRAIENARLHNELGESEEWHRTFIENSLAAFLEGDIKGRILFVNEGACKIIGLEREAILAKWVGDFFVFDQETGRTREKMLQETGSLVGSHRQLRAAGGQIKDISITTRAVRDHDGNLVRFQSIFLDITEQQHLLEELAQRNQDLGVLNAIANILSHPLEIPRALDQVCQQIASITRMETVVLYLTNEAQTHVNLLAHHGLSDNLLAQAHEVGLDDSVTRRVAGEGKTIALDDVSAALEPGLDGVRAEGYHAGIGVPIHRRDKPVGAIFVGSKTLTRYDQSDVELLLNIGKQIGVALENADLYRQMQQRVSELSGLAELSAACVSTLDPHALSEIAVDWTRKLLQVDAAGIRLFEGETLRLGAARLANVEARAEERIEMDPFLRSIVVDRVPSVVHDVDADPSVSLIQRQRYKASNTGAAAVVPLPTRERVIGILSVGYTQPHHWSDREIELLKTIANQVANALDNAQLFQNVLSEQRKVQAIFDSGLSGLFVTDAAGRIVMFNRAAERITGWAFDQVRGKNWTELLGDEAAGVAGESLITTALARKQSAFAQDGRAIKTRDGRIIPVAKAAAPLLDDKDNVVGAVGAFWDLTKEKATEVEREDFLRMVAHEIRSPLTALLSALQLLERSDLSKPDREDAWAIVKTHGERLKKFVAQFLDYESTQNSSPAANLEPVDIVLCARALAHRVITAKGTHRFEIKSPKPAPLVSADPNLVDLVLRNFLDNAVSYSPAGTTITISAKVVDDGWVDLAVRDRGPGIPPAEQEKIFKRFYRVTRPEATPVYGHGLGLWIAQNNATAMGGKIFVDSVEGHGATFHLMLRRYR